MTKKIAFLLFPGFEMLDFYGPISVFSSHKLNAFYECLTVSENAGQVPSSRGIQTVTEHNFESCPPVDLLMVPGKVLSLMSSTRLHCIVASEGLRAVDTDRPVYWGSWGSRKRLSLIATSLCCHEHHEFTPPGCTGGLGTRKEVNNGHLMDFMQRMLAPDASKPGSASPYLLTVCTGAALAARGGLLDGKKATTNKVGYSVNPDISAVFSSCEASPDSILLRSRCCWKGAWAWATTQGKPGAITWQKQARWVEDGTVWTSAGVTAGKLGGSLHLPGVLQQRSVVERKDITQQSTLAICESLNA